MEQNRRNITTGSGGRSTGYGRAGDTSWSRRENASSARRSSAGVSASGRRSVSSETAPRRQGSGKRPSSGRNGRSRRRKNILKTWLPVILLLLVILCLGGTLFLYHNGKNDVPQVTVDLELLDSPYAVLIDRDTGTVLASRRSTEQMYPASMTKIMTVLVAAEEIKDLNTTITLSYDYFQELYDRDASRAGFEPGEEARIIDLMYGALLPSGAECCKELAIQTAGSETDFAELMNKKVQELGLTGTHFTNCTGLHDSNQYSTVADMAAILREALKNNTFYEIFTSHYYTVPASNVHPDGFTFWSSMFKAMEDSTVAGGEILGGKTGYTGDAGYCLASLARVDDRDYILVTGGIAEAPRTAKYHIDDAFRAYGQISGGTQE